MSDFLGNLAMKSLGVAPLVQPRPLSPFEALPAEGALAARAKRAAERPAEPIELFTEVVDGARPERPLTPGPSAARSGRFGDPFAARVPGADVERLDEDQPASLLQPAVGALRAAPQPESEPGPHPASQPAALRPAPLDGAQQAVPQPAALPATQLAAETQQVVSSQAPAPPARPVMAPASEDQAEALHRRRALTPVVEEIKSGPIQGRAFSAQAETQAERAERATAPTISVTIGRVEVRAAIAPRAAPEPRRERRATPSLDDYLRARSGGKP